MKNITKNKTTSSKVKALQKPKGKNKGLILKDCNIEHILSKADLNRAKAFGIRATTWLSIIFASMKILKTIWEILNSFFYKKKFIAV